LGFLALLGGPGGLPELACGSDKASRKPPARLRCSAPLMGIRKASRYKGSAQEIPASCGQPSKTAKNRQTSSSGSAATPFRVPVWSAEQRRSRRKRGEDCLRAQPEFRSPRRVRVAQGSRRSRPRNPGSPSSLATFFLAKQEESTPARKAENNG